MDLCDEGSSLLNVQRVSVSVQYYECVKWLKLSEVYLFVENIKKRFPFSNAL